RYPGTGPPNPSGPANPSGRGAGSVQPSQTTIAEAIPASWDSDRWIVPTPSSAARRATVPVIENDGRPCGSVITSASVQTIPPGAPSAFASASLAANRAAREAVGFSASAGVNRRRTRPGRRSSVAANRATSQTSIPTPTIIGRDELGTGR